MKGTIGLLVLAVASASAQDSSFSRLHLRASGFSMPVTGHIADHWRPGLGGQLELATNVGRTDLAISLGRISFDPIAENPPFTEMLIAVGWTVRVLDGNRFAADAGVRLADVRFEFDDPAIVEGLQNEREKLASALGRAHLAVTRSYGVFAEASYGVLMLSTKTPVVVVAVGVERRGATPGWLIRLLK